MPVEVTKMLIAPLGILQLRACSQRLTGVIILAGPATAPVLAETADDATLAVLEQARQQFVEYFLGHRREFTVPLDLSGLPPFTRQVLSFLRAVPYGATVTYAELAARAGNPGAARAVGRAMAVNPLPIVIPCHRVIAAGGRLGGYSGAGGVRTKEWLLAFEQNNRL